MYESCTSCDSNAILEDVTNGCNVCTECGTVQSEYTSHEYVIHSTSSDTPSNALVESTTIVRVHDSRMYLFDTFEICTEYIVQPVLDLTVQYFTDFITIHPTRGAMRKGAFVCCMYRSFAACGIHRSLKELSASTGIDSATLTRANKAVGMALNTATRTLEHPLLRSDQLIGRMCDRIDTTEDIRRIVRRKCMELDHVITIGHFLRQMTPVSIAAGIIAHVCCQLGVCTKQCISATIGVSLITVDKIIRCINQIYNR